MSCGNLERGCEEGGSSDNVPDRPTVSFTFKITPEERETKARERPEDPDKRFPSALEEKRIPHLALSPRYWLLEP